MTARAVYVARWGARASAAILAAWAGGVFLLTLAPLARHIEYFERPGPQYRTAIIALLAAFAAALLLYPRLRTDRLRRLEPRLLTGFAAGLVFLAEPLGALVAVALLAASYAAGATVLARFEIATPSAAARLPLAAGIGLGLLILALIPVGLAGLYGPLSSAALLLAPLIAFRSRVVELGRDITALTSAWVDDEAARSPLAGVVMAAAPAFVAVFLLCALAPSIAYDAVSHHLPAARHYLMHGVLEPLPMIDADFSQFGMFTLGHSVAYSYYPQSFEELLTLTWSLGGQPAAQLVTPVFFLLTLPLGAAVARLCGVSRLGCLIGLALYAAMPVASWTGAIAKNDFPLTFFQLAALYAVLQARDRQEDRPGGWLLLTAFFLGLSFGVKHVALFGAIPIGLLALDAVRRRRGAVRLAASMALVFALAGLFWHARTYVLTGSPIYPANTRVATTPLRAVDLSIHSRPEAYWLYPWIAHFDGGAVLESPTSAPMGFALLLFGAVWALVKRREASPAERACWLYLGLYYLYWIYVWGVLRYALAPLLVLCLLLGGRIAGLAAQAAPRRIVQATLIYSFAFALLPGMILEVNAPQLAYFAGRLDKAGYLREAMADYGVIESLNARVNPDDRVITVNNCSSAYAWDPARFRCIREPNRHDEDWFDEMAGVIVEARPRYIVLPAGRVGDSVREALPAGLYSEEVYADKSFRAFR